MGLYKQECNSTEYCPENVTALASCSPNSVFTIDPLVGTCFTGKEIAGPNKRSEVTTCGDQRDALCPSEDACAENGLENGLGMALDSPELVWIGQDWKIGWSLVA